MKNLTHLLFLLVIALCASCRNETEEFDVRYEDAPKSYKDTTYIREFSNAGYDTSMPLFSYNSYSAVTRTHPDRSHGTDTDVIWEKYTDVKLLDSPDYKLLKITSIPKKIKYHENQHENIE